MNRKESAICIFKQFLENQKMLPPENTTENGDPRRSARIFSSTGFSVSDQSFLWCFLAPPFYISIILLHIADFFLFIYNLIYDFH